MTEANFCRSSETTGYSRGTLNHEVKSIAFRALEVMHYIDVGLRLLSIGICLHSNTRVLTDNCGRVAEENYTKKKLVRGLELASCYVSKFRKWLWFCGSR